MPVFLTIDVNKLNSEFIKLRIGCMRYKCFKDTLCLMSQNVSLLRQGKVTIITRLRSTHLQTFYTCKFYCDGSICWIKKMNFL